MDMYFTDLSLIERELIFLYVLYKFYAYCYLISNNLDAISITRPAWAGFKTAEEGRTKIM